MSRARSPYPADYRRQRIGLVHAGRSPKELARELEPSALTIRNWVVQVARDAGQRADGPSAAEREELRQRRHFGIGCDSPATYAQRHTHTTQTPKPQTVH